MWPWRLRAEFLSLVSHELRAPLAAIKGSAATVLSGAPAPDPAEMLQFFQIINEQADQMRGLISDLLDAGHIEAGTLSVTPEPTDVADQKHLLGGYTSPQNVSTDLRMHIGDLPGKLLRKKRAKDRAMANTGKPTKTKALQVAEPPPIRPEVLTGEGDVGERVATLGRCFAGGVIHHYHLSTGHMAQIPRSELRPETLAALRPIVKAATSGHAMPLPGFTEYFLSIRNTWIGAVGWLIEGTEGRVMVRCVTAWTVGGAAKGVRWLAAELPAELDLPCCLVRLGVPLLEDPAAASLLDDAERCIGWALLPTAP